LILGLSLYNVRTRAATWHRCRSEDIVPEWVVVGCRECLGLGLRARETQQVLKAVLCRADERKEIVIVAERVVIFILETREWSE